MSALQVLGLAAGVGLVACLVTYALAWWVIGHEPLLDRNCHCRRCR